jgi:hypothetical protein
MLHRPPSVSTTLILAACRKRQIHDSCIPRESSTNIHSGPIGPIHHTARSRGSGRRVPYRCPPTPCIDKWVAKSRAACVGSPTQTPSPAVRFRLSPTIANSRLLRRESQPTAPSVRAMNRRGLVNPPCGRYQSFKGLPRHADATSSVTSASLPVQVEPACPRRSRRASRASRTFIAYR